MNTTSRNLPKLEPVSVRGKLAVTPKEFRLGEFKTQKEIYTERNTVRVQKMFQHGLPNRFLKDANLQSAHFSIRRIPMMAQSFDRRRLETETDS